MSTSSVAVLATMGSGYWMPDSMFYVSSSYAQIFTERLLWTRPGARHKDVGGNTFDMASARLRFSQDNGVQGAMPY